MNLFYPCFIKNSGNVAVGATPSRVTEGAFDPDPGHLMFVNPTTGILIQKTKKDIICCPLSQMGIDNKSYLLAGKPLSFEEILSYGYEAKKEEPIVEEKPVEKKKVAKKKVVKKKK